MNPDEAAALLGHAAAFDNRTPSAAAAMAWAAALHDVPLDADAKDAVATYYTTAPQDSKERLWILPHHIRTLRTKIRNARLENFQYEPVPDETVSEYLARYKGQVAAIASGRVAAPAGRPALEGGPTREFVAELEARGWQGNRAVDDEDDTVTEDIDLVRRRGPLGVECPACQAAVGRPCKSPGSSEKQPMGKPRVEPHSARLRAAKGQPEQTLEERAAQEQRIRDMSARHLARLKQKAEDIPDADITEEAS
ncbi:zinc finger domain-containing protein [Streptomyces sp. NPDC004376]